MKPNQPNINFIRHLLDINVLFYNDHRLSPLHISLYNALFLEWNQCGFKNPISVSRSELMNMSKIGSINTYTKILKELDKYAYIEYHPSFNRFIGSKITMLTFNKGFNKAYDNTPHQTNEIELIPYLNLTKQKETKQTFKSDYGQTSKENKKDELLLPSENSSAEKKLHSFPANLQEVEIHFSEKKFPPAEAQKFYNYFESNGWLVGGRSKMKNWKAAANNWMLNAQSFNKTALSPNHLHINQEKDYSIPL